MSCISSPASSWFFFVSLIIRYFLSCILLGLSNFLKSYLLLLFYPLWQIFFHILCCNAPISLVTFSTNTSNFIASHCISCLWQLSAPNMEKSRKRTWKEFGFYGPVFTTFQEKMHLYFVLFAFTLKTVLVYTEWRSQALTHTHARREQNINNVSKQIFVWTISHSVFKKLHFQWNWGPLSCKRTPGTQWKLFISTRQHGIKCVMSRGCVWGAVVFELWPKPSRSHVSHGHCCARPRGENAVRIPKGQREVGKWLLSQHFVFSVERSRELKFLSV